ncbi:MAG: GNAT family N-acetyltransferase [Kofleriaceae bacterium]
MATDLGLLARRGTVTDRGDYIVARSPDEPGYFYGNLLVLPAPPQIGEVAFWTRRFTDELGDDPAITHVTFRWDGITGDVGARAELEAAGFVIEVDQVMTATALAAPSTAFEIRPLVAADMAAVTALGFAIGDRHDEAFRAFHGRRGAWKRALVETGEAAFWGAFDRGELVGSLGLVPLGELGRYQDVQTAVSHRKRGIASALLAASARATTCTQLVIVAMPDSDAARVYERAGFRVSERTASACRWTTSRT